AAARIRTVEGAAVAIETRAESGHCMNETPEARAFSGQAAEGLHLFSEAFVDAPFILQGLLELRYGCEELVAATCGSGMIHAGHFPSLEVPGSPHGSAAHGNRSDSNERNGGLSGSNPGAGSILLAKGRWRCRG